MDKAITLPLIVLVGLAGCIPHREELRPSAVIPATLPLSAPRSTSSPSPSPACLPIPYSTGDSDTATRSMSPEELALFIGMEFPPNPHGVTAEWASIAYSAESPGTKEFTIYSVLYEDSRMVWMVETVATSAGCEVERVVAAFSPPPLKPGQAIVGFWCGNAPDHASSDPNLVALVQVPTSYGMAEDIETLWRANTSNLQFEEVSAEGAYCFPDAFSSTY